MVTVLAQYQQNLRDIGRALAERRLERGLTIENIASATNLRMFFLTCMEEGQFEKLPGGIYTTGLAKLYMTYLGFDEAQCHIWLQNLSSAPSEDDALLDSSLEGHLVEKTFLPTWWVGGSLLVMMCCFGYWMWSSERSELEIPALMEQQPATEDETDTSKNSETAALALYARGTTWIKITAEDNSIVHTQLLKKGVTIDLTPYIGKNLTVGDGRQLVMYKAGTEVGPLSDAASDDSPVLIENKPIQTND